MKPFLVHDFAKVTVPFCSIICGFEAFWPNVIVIWDPGVSKQCVQMHQWLSFHVIRIWCTEDLTFHFPIFHCFQSGTFVHIATSRCLDIKQTNNSSSGQSYIATSPCNRAPTQSWTQHNVTMKNTWFTWQWLTSISDWYVDSSWQARVVDSRQLLTGDSGWQVTVVDRWQWLTADIWQWTVVGRRLWLMVDSGWQPTVLVTGDCCAWRVIVVDRSQLLTAWYWSTVGSGWQGTVVDRRLRCHRLASDIIHFIIKRTRVRAQRTRARELHAPINAMLKWFQVCSTRSTHVRSTHVRSIINWIIVVDRS